MGYALAEEAAARGARVTLVSGHVSIAHDFSPSVDVVRVESARQMLDACEAAFADADAAIMCAAVADYAPADPSDTKIKRECNEPPVIRLVKNPDIARTLGERKRSGQILVGFALETDHEGDNAISKLKSKNLDMIVLNSLRDAGAGFSTDTNKITIYTADGRTVPFPLKDKREVADDILDIMLTL